MKLTGECFLSLNENVVEEIALDGVRNVQKDFIIRSWPNFKKLRSLGFRNFYEDRFDCVADCIKLCSKLKKLSILKTIINKDSQLFTSSNNIENLIISLLNDPEEENNFLHYVCRNLRELKYLDIRYYGDLYDNGIDDDVVNAICELPKLEVLKICNAGGITGSGFEKGFNLKKLKCTDCYDVCDESLTMLLECATNLECLDIVNCGIITSDTINAAVEVVKNRTKYLPLKIKMGGDTNINIDDIEDDLPTLLHLIQEREIE